MGEEVERKKEQNEVMLAKEDSERKRASERERERER